ncbi:Unknown protein [Striga hermonthica]|uniref:Late embryogenesis abundant protein LEA-2 subgroup domain-containing protein n=1 Tax=Striga hermonthica TaxID=68872 RepID=A0A9N7NN04_STRHE|nr:Unknown protein [Striga hermonthica]
MFRQEREANPHFLPRHTNNDPIIDFSRQRTPPPPQRPRPPPPQHHSPTSIEPPYAPRPQPPTQLPQTQPKPLSSHSGRGHHNNHPSLLRGPTSRRTRPMAWLVAALCALFWMIVIVAGLIVLIVYLVFQPKLPRFDISAATLNAAYLDLGYLLNADITLLANFTNPNTKVDVDFTYIVLDVYYEKNIIATRYVSPFSVRKRESRFAAVHMMASQVRLSTGLSLELQRQMENGRVRFVVKGAFRTRSKLGGVFRYSYWLYAQCDVEVAAPPTGVLIRKRCVTTRCRARARASSCVGSSFTAAVGLVLAGKRAWEDDGGWSFAFCCWWYVLWSVVARLSLAARESGGSNLGCGGLRADRRRMLHKVELAEVWSSLRVRTEAARWLSWFGMDAWGRDGELAGENGGHRDGATNEELTSRVSCGFELRREEVSSELWDGAFVGTVVDL